MVSTHLPYSQVFSQYSFTTPTRNDCSQFILFCILTDDDIRSPITRSQSTRPSPVPTGIYLIGEYDTEVSYQGPPPY